MVPNQLIYLSYGKNDNIITEARFSMLSAIHRRTSDDFRIVVITDSPSAFADLPVTVNSITAETISDWAGPHHYHHRCKPAALLSVLAQADKSILIDSDTVLLDCPSKLFELISAKTMLVDRVLQAYGRRDDGYYIHCHHHLNPSYGTDRRCHYVNSGLIGLTRENRAVLETTLKVIDEIYPMAGKPFHTEQAALSVALYFHHLKPVSHKLQVQHYYSKKHIYRAQARVFLLAHPEPLSAQTHRHLLDYRLSIPRVALNYNARLKLRSLRIKGDKALRRFYIEAMRAGFPYRDQHPHVIDEMYLGAARNFRQRNANQFERGRTRGIASLLPAGIMPSAVQARVDAAMQSIFELNKPSA